MPAMRGRCARNDGHGGPIAYQKRGNFCQIGPKLERQPPQQPPKPPPKRAEMRPNWCGIGADWVRNWAEIDPTPPHFAPQGGWNPAQNRTTFGGKKSPLCQKVEFWEDWSREIRGLEFLRLSKGRKFYDKRKMSVFERLLEDLDVGMAEFFFGGEAFGGMESDGFAVELSDEGDVVAFL